METSILLLSHWLGDYMFQFPFGQMAIKKRHDSSVCFLHVLIYTTFCIPLVILYCHANYQVIALFLIGLTHFLQDRFWFPLKVYEKKLNELKMNEEYKNWYPILYVIIDNGYHLFCNFVIINVL